MVKPAILIVDDHPEILHKLKNDLEQKYTDHFHIIDAHSGQNALDQLKQMYLHNEPLALLLV
ncbi:MAG: fused response regulator/thioredoxin-disulfide reductase, partial [Ktedonobacteraceae bacterium]